MMHEHTLQELLKLHCEVQNSMKAVMLFKYHGFYSLFFFFILK